MTSSSSRSTGRFAHQRLEQDQMALAVVSRRFRTWALLAVAVPLARTAPSRNDTHANSPT